MNKKLQKGITTAMAAAMGVGIVAPTAAVIAAPVTGWVNTASGWTYLENGTKVTNAWRLVGGSWYYLGANGIMATGWNNIGGTWYYLNADGSMKTGWLQEGTTWYFLKTSGAMAKNEWQLVNGVYYYFKTSGAMAANETTPDGYKVDANGAWIKDQVVTGIVGKVSSVSAVNNTTFEINVTLAETVAADKLSGTKLTLTGARDVTATFAKVEGNVAVYTVDNKGLLQPGNGTADGTYVVTSSNLTIAADTITTYSEILTGNMVKGFVYDSVGTHDAIAGATVEINGRTVKTDAYGFYSIPTNSGLRTVTVTAAGYFQGKATNVSVSRNYNTAQNFALTQYDQDKLFVHGVAMNSSNSNPINGATVALYELNGSTWTKVDTMTTGADGKFNFANKGVVANVDSIATNYVLDGKGAKINELELSKSYKVVISKGLAAANLVDVYETKEAQFNLANYSMDTNMKNVAVRPIKELKKATFQVQWTRDAENALSTAGAIVDKADISVDVLATDGETVLRSGNLNDLSVTSGKLTEAFDLVGNSFFGASVKPHLPSGTYFLRVKDAKFDTAGQINATTIIPVTVTEGVDVASPVTTIEKAVTGTIDSKISSVKYAEALTNQVATQTLKAVSDNIGTLTADEVGVEYTVTQKVSGVDVVVGTVASSPFVYATAPTTSMTTSSNVNYLVKDVEYTATPTQSLIRGAATKVTAGGAVSQVTASYSSAADVENFKITNVTGLPVNAVFNNVKLVDKNGNVVAETGEFEVDAVNYSSIAIPDDAFDGVAPGEYKVLVDLKGFKPVEGKLEKVIDFQKATLTVDKAFEAIKTTTVSGFVRFADDNTNVADADATPEATVILYDASGKIVAANDFGTTANQGTYSLVDGTNGTFAAGTYTMVVRGEGFETQVKQVTLTGNDDNIIDIYVTRGGEGKAKLAVRDENNAALTGGVVDLTDKYYVSDLDNVDDLAEASLTFDGEYTLTANGSGIEWTTADALSVGDYSLTITSPKTVKYTDTITIKDVNDTYYNSITVSNRVVGKVVDLTVNFAGTGDYDFVVVKDNKGNVVANGMEAVVTSNAVTVQVGANDTYTVEVYANNGKFVGSSKVTVQDFAKSVTVALDTAARD